MIKGKLTNRTTPRTVLSSPATLSQLKEVTLRLKRKEQTINLMGLIGMLKQQHHLAADDIRDCFSNILAHLTKDSGDFHSVKALLCQICQGKFTKASGLVNVMRRREGTWMYNLDPTDKLSLGNSFYEVSSCVPQDHFKAERYLNTTLNAGKWEANYYLDLMSTSGKGLTQCNLRALEFYNAGTRAKYPKAMTRLSIFYFSGTAVEVNQPHGIMLVGQAAKAEDPAGLSVLS